MRDILYREREMERNMETKRRGEGIMCLENNTIISTA